MSPRAASAAARASAGHEWQGIVASPGFAEGPLHRLDGAAARYVPRGNKEAEREALQAALATASEQLAGLIGLAEGEAADMLEFQLAMVEDDALTGPALAAIDSSADAAHAWDAALAAEIAGYEASPEEYFRARAADLRDIRDRVRRALLGEDEAVVAPGAILFGADIGPTRFLEVDWSAGGGIALTEGSAASHVAMLARARGVPMLVGLGPVAVPEIEIPAFLDGGRGALLLDPPDAAIDLFRSAAAQFREAREGARLYLSRPAATKDGTPVRVQVNVADPSDVERIDIGHCDGIGLMRTEFLFGKGGGLPDEETQYRAYRKVLEWAAGKPVTIRTVDAGGDKPIPGFTVEEGNPFLGLRGIRLSLDRPDIFRVQIRALLRAAVHGTLKVMAPMVAVASEYEATVALFHEEAEALAAAGVPHAMPPLGIMVEVPSVAIAPEPFADVAFFSIGSNDLTQYVMAAARDNGRVAALNSVTNPAVLRLIGNVCAYAKANGIPVSLCGDAGGDPAAIPELLKAGLRDLSVVPAQLAVAKAAIAAVDLKAGA